MADYFDEDDDEDEYFLEITEEELTGKEPRFFKCEEAEVTSEVRETQKVDELVRQYREIRGQMATDSKSFKARKARMQLQLNIISSILVHRGDLAGVDSFTTANGTAFRQKKEKFPIVEWDEFTKYLMESGHFHAVQKRTSPNAIKEIREVDGKLPPGIGCLEETVFSVRAPTKRGSK
jgi:hypothetical protein